MENPRTTSARDHDDHEMIDAAVAETTPGQGSTSGGHLAVDLATQSEHDQVGDPEGSLRVEKTDKINNNTDRAGHSGGGDHQL